MFSHLISGEIPFDDDPDAPAPLSLEDAPVQALVNAQAATLTWLDELGAITTDPTPDGKPQTIEEAAARAARDAFCSVTNPYEDPMAAKSKLMALSAPPAVRHLAGMLTQYDWAYVKQAGEIRGYIVAKLVEHSRNLDPKVSLAALKALGSVTEVGAFTERIEITRPQAEVTAEAIADRLRERLRQYLPAPTPAPVTEVVEDAVVLQTLQHATPTKELT